MAIEILETLRKHFGNRKEFSRNDYLHSFGKASEALLYTALFMPELVEIGSCVFLKINVLSEEAVKNEIININSMEVKKVELAYNFIEIGYVFDANGRDFLDNDEKILASCICNSWKGWLKVKFPQRKFEIEIFSAEETGSTIGVQFYEVR